MDQYLIKNTTKAQREKIVSDALGFDDIGCDGVAGASMYDMYQPYIDGKMELSEVKKSFQTNYVGGNYGPEEKGTCPHVK